jgi:hypothetical protein
VLIAVSTRGTGLFFHTIRIRNMLADHPETMCPWLTDGMLVARKNGSAIRRLKAGKAAARFALSAFQLRRVSEDAMARPVAAERSFAG